MGLGSDLMRGGEGLLLPLGPASGEQALAGRLLSAPCGAAHCTSLLPFILSSPWLRARPPPLPKTLPLGKTTRRRCAGQWCQLVLAGGLSPVFSPPLCASASSSTRPLQRRHSPCREQGLSSRGGPRP